MLHPRGMRSRTKPKDRAEIPLGPERIVGRPHLSGRRERDTMRKLALLALVAATLAPGCGSSDEPTVSGADASTDHATDSAEDRELDTMGEAPDNDVDAAAEGDAGLADDTSVS